MRAEQRGIARGDLAIAIGIVALGLVAAWQTTLIPQSAYAAVGPRAFAWFASAMLVIMGGLLAVDALRGGWSADADDFGEVDWHGGLWMVGALAANVLLIDLDLPRLGTVGFTIASTVTFALTARAFGSRRLLRDAGIGFLLALVAYIGFDRVLGYKIGTGLIERLI